MREKINRYKNSKLRDLLRNSKSYYTRQFVRTGATDDRIRVATWLQDYNEVIK